jgi:hypothetical protein
MTGAPTAPGADPLDRMIDGLQSAAAREATRRDRGSKGRVNPGRWAIIQGRVAKVHNHGPETNPHEPGSAAAFCWMAGYNGTAKREAEIKRTSKALIAARAGRNVKRETGAGQAGRGKTGRGRSVLGPRRDWSDLDDEVLELCTGGQDALSDTEIGTVLIRSAQGVRNHRARQRTEKDKP